MARRMPPIVNVTLAACLFALASAPGLALAQGSNDFMSGRLFQIALETAPSFSAEGTPQFGTLNQGETRSFEQNLVRGTCYSWIAVGDTGQTDLDLTITVAGASVSNDDAVDDWPITQYCAPADAVANVVLTMYSGSGGFGYNSYSRHFGGEDYLELQMNYLASLFAADHVPAASLLRATLAQGAEESYPLQLNGGRCYTIIGTAGPGVGDLDFFLTDTASGQVVQSDVAPDAAPVVGVCPSQNGNFTLRVVMFQGAGDFAWQPFMITF